MVLEGDLFGRLLFQCLLGFGPGTAGSEFMGRRNFIILLASGSESEIWSQSVRTFF